jgi:hypothetical protein
MQEPRSQRLRPRHALLALAVAAAIAVPAVAFADAIGHLLGLSNQGTPVPASTLSKDTSLARAMQALGFPTTLQLLGTRDGISFYAVQKPGGQFCFAVTDASTPAGARRAASDVGCDGASSSTRIVDPPPSLYAATNRPVQYSPDVDFEARVLPRAAARPADSESCSAASAFSFRRVRVSGFFALSIARTCSRLRLSGRRS